MMYNQRSNIESTFFALRRKYGEIARARTWFGQFRNLILKFVSRHIELTIDYSSACIRVSKQGPIRVKRGYVAEWARTDDVLPVLFEPITARVTASQPTPDTPDPELVASLRGSYAPK